MDTAGNAKPVKIVLAGSPNVGKSAVFGCLTKKYVTISNYPGTTVEIASGQMTIGGAQCDVLDTPGIYTLKPISDEEKITLDILLKRPDVIIHIIDAKNLDRQLPLTFQLKNFPVPVIVVLNMYDEANGLGMTINTTLLSERLGLPVVATVATKGRGIDILMDKIGSVIDEHKCDPKNNDQMETIELDEKTLQEFYSKAGKIAEEVATKDSGAKADEPSIIRAKWLHYLDEILISPFTGFIVVAMVLYFGLYKFVGVLGAGELVDLFEGAYETHVTAPLQNFLASHITSTPVLNLLTGEYGIFSLAFRYAFTIIMPIVTLFFLVFAVLEDTGYLTRLAFLLDSSLKKLGLSGRAIIPMVLGLGCVTMATVVTRTLQTKRERFIATMLLSLCIPCSAQLGVILALLSTNPVLLFLWGMIILSIFIVTGILLSRFTPGIPPIFVMEMPPLRIPSARHILKKTYARVIWYLKEVVPVFVLASVIIWLFELLGLFSKLIALIERPLALMGLPAKTAHAFIFGFFRRDYGAAGLYDLHHAGVLDGRALLTATVVITLFLPCITQFVITIKERGLKMGLSVAGFTLAFAFAVGVVLNSVLDCVTGMGCLK